MKFLVFQHVAHEHPGLIKKWADKKKITLKIVKLWPASRGEKSYKIPNVLDYDGLIIMGGPMGVYENYPSEESEIKTIKKVLGNLPIIGFCLGAQLLAHALGAKVYQNKIKDKRVKEIGYYQVDLTKDGKSAPILKGFKSPLKVFQWHGDAFDLPKKAKLLATNANCKNQAFVYKNAFGFLFHFEFSPEMVLNQIKVDKEWIHQDHQMDEEKLRKDAKKYKSLMEKQCQMLFENFAKVDREEL